MGKTKNEIAQQYAIDNGINGFKVDGNRMIYYENYPATPTEQKYTVKVIVRLDTLQKSEQKLNYLNPKGDLNLKKEGIKNETNTLQN